MRKKLKASYTLIEQLYTGAQQAISAASQKKQPPTLIKDMKEELFVLTQWVEDLKGSAERAGAITTLTQAKVWKADLDPEDLANGCPSVKEDESPFSVENFAAMAREMRPLERKLAEDTNLSHYQAVYDADNKKVNAPIHESQDLTPPISKHTFAPDIDPQHLFLMKLYSKL